ncbi:hypothetical protein D1816_07855 [Aquimarina sp. AD10]|uniref:hypothetical protein n=1 Tax=Aquimarina TaxID=290174 RepID=UPI00082A6048|nr:MULTISPECIES: hypothetical protein [Aquimarina]AXT60266.1 hypothetical protein D1816_07855 [Aquimarina sp. AD10]
MKNYIFIVFVISSCWLYPNNTSHSLKSNSEEYSQNPRDRKLSADEVKQRGLDVLANEITENFESLDLKKTARSAIFETSYGFRWKLVNLHTGKKIIVKVDKDFKLISARDNKNTKIMKP